MHPKHLKIEDYTYHLPDERIAQFPKEERDTSKLLVYDNSSITEDIYRNITDYLAADSLVVFNQTKVVQVRLLFQKTTGANIEIFCLEPDNRYADMQTAMTQKGEVFWKCLVGGANKWKNDNVLFLKDDVLGITIEAQLIERQEGVFLIRLKWNSDAISFAEVLQSVGKVPLPPYMHREMQTTDKERYQTIYACEEGSVAAPTAGLHFTPYIFEQFNAKNIQQAFLTLHVGAGTFKQVKSEKIADHEMHAEWIEITSELLEHLIEKIDSVVAVGTTSMRTLESVYWLGLKLHHNLDIDWDGNAITQWEPYELIADIDAKSALKCLLNWMKEQKIVKLITRTQILIAPSYRSMIVNTLITNFHQPNSTLLLLVAALIGDDWKKIYEYALNNDFRFLSYGDGCLIKTK
jgi:S-adenosylmethionine:tRNA ribosyltransferase-isomerase